ncbi:hypothetical protein SLEP1_g55718 [Rubroshorea leprosula]|uniref:Uncharacterized protein n=1 Tax=Rubroshorea leprosula TaxID=152421 RepID=A0AAV5MJ98_9ROSI|nr:hypothetical protein SLEP1_g55718 [Rubroshorea leprosula]
MDFPVKFLHGFVSNLVMITDARQWEFVNIGTCQDLYL